MLKYPLSISFPAFSITPQITVKDADDGIVLTAAKKLLSSKEEIHVASNGQPLYTIISHESRITEIPSNWDIIAVNGQKTLGVINDAFLSTIEMVELSGNPLSRGTGIIGDLIQQSLNLRALKMYWLSDTNGQHMGYVAPDKASFAAMELPFASMIRKLPGIFFRFITPRYNICLGDKVVLFMQKKRTFFIDTYTLEKRSELSDMNEVLLINNILLALVYERQMLKDIYAF